MATAPSPSNQLAVAATAMSDDPRRAPKVARRLGFAGVAFWAVLPSLDLTQLSATGRREFRHILSSQDQQLAGLWADIGPKGFGPGADVDRVLARLDRVLEAARGLAAPLVCLDVGPLPPAPRAAKPKPKVTSDMAGLILLPEPLAAPAPEGTSLSQIPAAVGPGFAAPGEAAPLDLGQPADPDGGGGAVRQQVGALPSAV